MRRLRQQIGDLADKTKAASEAVASKAAQETRHLADASKAAAERARDKLEGAEEAPPSPSPERSSSQPDDVDWEAWGQFLAEWDDGFVREKKFVHLVNRGIPDQLRGRIWGELAASISGQRLSEMYGTAVMSNALSEIEAVYPVLIEKRAERATEEQIRKDLHRTMPDDPMFSEAGGEGQTALYHIAKAYSLYDADVGYCQGMANLAGILLLRMPEEQAFVVLVQLMEQYDLRGQYLPGMPALVCRLWMLQQLMREHTPVLCDHFEQLGVDAATYATEWFLTVFAYKFSGETSARIWDWLMLNGVLGMFQVAIGMFRDVEEDVCELDFEQLIYFFRDGLAVRYTSRKGIDRLMKHANSTKLKDSKLVKLEAAYHEMMGGLEQTDPKKLASKLRKLEKQKKKATDESAKLAELTSQAALEGSELQAGLQQLRQETEQMRELLTKAEAKLAEQGDTNAALEAKLSTSKGAAQTCAESAHANRREIDSLRKFNEAV